MEIDIHVRKENPLLNREEIKIMISHPGVAVPSRDRVVRKLSAELNKDRNQIIVRELQGQFGAAKTLATVMVYETEEQAKKIERPYIIRRHAQVGEEKGE